MSDNRLAALPGCLASCPALHTLLCYGNRLVGLPPALASAPALRRGRGVSRSTLGGLLCISRPSRGAAWINAPGRRYLWAEGNPGLQPGPFLEAAAGGSRGAQLKAVGLDEGQLASVGSGVLASCGAFLRRSRVVPGEGPGYFKLQPYGEAGEAASAEAEDPEAEALVAPKAAGRGRALVVLFGSAPGEPNWAGLMKRVREGIRLPQQQQFDVLFVVDPSRYGGWRARTARPHDGGGMPTPSLPPPVYGSSRTWYGGGEGAVFEQYRDRLAAACADYPRVLMLGDSMGATAALMFSDLATAAIAFCPQIDLTTSAIRPGTGPEG